MYNNKYPQQTFQPTFGQGTFQRAPQYQPGNLAVNSGVRNELLYRYVQECVPQVANQLSVDRIIEGTSVPMMPNFYLQDEVVVAVAQAITSRYNIPNPWASQLSEAQICNGMYDVMVAHQNQAKAQAGFGATFSQQYNGMVQQPRQSVTAGIYNTQRTIPTQPGVGKFEPIPKQTPPGATPTFTGSTSMSQKPATQEKKSTKLQLKSTVLAKFPDKLGIKQPLVSEIDTSTDTIVVRFPATVKPKDVDAKLDQIRENLGGHKKYIIHAVEKVNDSMDNVAQEDVVAVVDMIKNMSERNDLFTDLVQYLAEGTDERINTFSVAQLLVSKFNESCDLGVFTKWLGDTVIAVDTVDEIISLLDGVAIDMGDPDVNNMLAQAVQNDEFKIAVRSTANQAVSFMKSINNIRKQNHKHVTYSYERPVLFSNVDTGDITMGLKHAQDTCIVPETHLLSQYVDDRIGAFVKMTVNLNKNNLLYYKCVGLKGDYLQLTRID